MRDVCVPYTHFVLFCSTRPLTRTLSLRAELNLPSRQARLPALTRTHAIAPSRKSVSDMGCEFVVVKPRRTQFPTRTTRAIGPPGRKSVSDIGYVFVVVNRPEPKFPRGARGR